jgi:hypothetical protein
VYWRNSFRKQTNKRKITFFEPFDNNNNDDDDNDDFFFIFHQLIDGSSRFSANDWLLYVDTEQKKSASAADRNEQTNARKFIKIVYR